MGCGKCKGRCKDGGEKSGTSLQYKREKEEEEEELPQGNTTAVPGKVLQGQITQVWAAVFHSVWKWLTGRCAHTHRVLIRCFVTPSFLSLTADNKRME